MAFDRLTEVIHILHGSTLEAGISSLCSCRFLFHSCLLWLLRHLERHPGLDLRKSTRWIHLGSRRGLWWSTWWVAPADSINSSDQLKLAATKKPGFGTGSQLADNLLFGCCATSTCIFTFFGVEHHILTLSQGAFRWLASNHPFPTSWSTNGLTFSRRLTISLRPQAKTSMRRLCWPPDLESGTGSRSRDRLWRLTC